MATEQAFQQLSATLDRLETVDIPKLLRKNLGDESLDAVFSPQLANINKARDFVRQYGKLVHDDSATQARSTFNSITDLMMAQAERTSAEYIGQRESFVQQVDTLLRDAARWRPVFVTAAVEERGFLQDEGIRQEYRSAVEDLRRQSEATLAKVKEEADKALAGAKTLADEIEARARKTATKISVKEAQDQFTSASADLDAKVKIWRNYGIWATVLMIVVAAGFMFWPLPGPNDWPVALYHTLLRLFVLTSVGAVSAFTFRMLRAHMHMAEKNRHRVRVANSVESFVNSALEPSQRDLLLAKLAEEIIDFGDSGIIKGGDDHESAIVSGDMLGRILAAVTARKP